MENSKSSNKKQIFRTTQVSPIEGKLPPQAPELEEAVLGAILLEKDAYYSVADLLKPESFYNDKYRYIYEAASQLAACHTPIDYLTVGDRLQSMEKLEQIGGQAFLTELTDKVPSAANIVYHAQIIAQKYAARELIRIASDITTNAFDPQIDVDDLMHHAESELFKVTQGNVKKDVSPVGDVLKEAIERLDTLSKNTQEFSGIPSGFTELDNITNGWQPSTLNIIAARPAMGKTAFVLSMAKNMAVDYHHSVAIFSLEMSNLELVNRLIANVAEINSYTLKKGKLTEDEWKHLSESTTCLQDARIYLDDTPNMSIFELSSKARKLNAEHGIDCIIIDYLQLMNASGMKYGNREQEVSMISRSLKGLAKELNIPIIALSQLNRGSTNREDKRPQLSDLRESGAIEQDADMVMMIHRPEAYGKKQDEDGNSLIGLAEIIVAKHRSGSVGDIKLTFKGEYVKFTNWENNNVQVIASKVSTQSPTNNPTTMDTDPLDPLYDNSFPSY